MKVTVSFDNIKVLVPCSEKMTVKDLIQSSLLRFKKAIDKNPDSFLKIHHLKTSDGGILDEDDFLYDVIDNKEIVYATFSERKSTERGDEGADGMSSNEVGILKETRSKTNHLFHHSRQKTPFDYEMCRQVSEPLLNKEVLEEIKVEKKVNVNETFLNSSRDSFEEKFFASSNCSQDDTILSVKNFDRTSSKKYFSPYCFNINNTKNNLAIIKNNKNNIENNFNSNNAISGHSFGKTSSFRRESIKFLKDNIRNDPVGSPTTNTPLHCTKDSNLSLSKLCEIVVIKNDGSNLGIHVIPHCDLIGRYSGLRVQKVEPGGQVERLGSLHANDVIIAINGLSLMGVSFDRAQYILFESLDREELLLKVLRYSSKSGLKESSNTSTPQNPIPFNPQSYNFASKSKKITLEASSPNFHFSKLYPNSNYFTPHSKAPLPNLVQRPSTCSKIPESPTYKFELRSFRQTIKLIKGVHGLGFSVTTYGNEENKPNKLIYIKNILEKGAAREDGKLQAGDILLKINGTDLMGKEQEEIVSFLRSVSFGEEVNLEVERIIPYNQREKQKQQLSHQQQKNQFDFQQNEQISQKPITSPLSKTNINTNILSNLNKTTSGSSLTKRLLSEIKLNQLDEGTNYSNVNTELGYERGTSRGVQIIPLKIILQGDLGIGISVRGKTKQTATGEIIDLGLFIKSINKTGAAFEDGRMLVGDRILEVNGQSLVGLSNSEARELLRYSLLTQGPQPELVCFLVERYNTASPILSVTQSASAKIVPPSPVTINLNENTLPRGLSNVKMRKFNGSQINIGLNQDKKRLSMVTQLLNIQDRKKMGIVNRQKTEEEKHHLYNSVTKSNDNNETLKKAFSIESLVSNQTLVKSPHLDNRTCGLIKNTLKKNKSTEHMPRKNFEELVENEIGIEVIKEQNKKTLKSILKNFNLFNKSKTRISNENFIQVRNVAPSPKKLKNILQINAKKSQASTEVRRKNEKKELKNMRSPFKQVYPNQLD